MRDWLWHRINNLRVSMIYRHRSARSIERVSRLCRLLWRYGYHVSKRES